MHPFGGNQRCPRCDKAVYAAEQAMGPGRKLYHKPCLACTICNKRLDSFTLLEHNEKPYCKSCHVKNFGTHDLRQANLPVVPYREGPAPESPPASPTRGNGSSVPPRIASPVRVLSTGGSYSNSSMLVAPRLRPNRSLATSPISGSFSHAEVDTASPDNRPPGVVESDPDIDAEEERDTVDQPTSQASPFPKSRPPPLTAVYTGTPTNTGRPGHGGIPRTVPLSPTRTGNYGTRPRHFPSRSVGSINMVQGIADNNGFPDAMSVVGSGGDIRQREVESDIIRPLAPSATGTRYGVALGGGVPIQTTGSGSPRKWGAGTPTCPRCGRSVYFAEQVKAVGKTYHKNCLRCVECNTSLDSSRLRDHDGEPLCMRCYSKLHGPQGGGYALLGKAGG
ncbi:hypothetical protein BDZ94DRAFT_1265974 [Collybia nuda]|uniref:LIM zinc-binding domain-containing protein n=1 Tax=Collybia nuda TaxID=64659 RepID=A0A9P5Y1A2_9AGAR|nr:hypothetical protein BDZ94DRAFT_1265974 [Collybia nuda]